MYTLAGGAGSAGSASSGDIPRFPGATFDSEEENYDDMDDSF